MKDDRIRYTTAEREAVEAHGVMAFILTNANPTAGEMAGRFIAQIDAMAAICRVRAGPFPFAVHPRRLVEIALS